jgi:hypothetical protein
MPKDNDDMNSTKALASAGEEVKINETPETSIHIQCSYISTDAIDTSETNVHIQCSYISTYTIDTPETLVNLQCYYLLNQYKTPETSVHNQCSYISKYTIDTPETLANLQCYYLLNSNVECSYFSLLISIKTKINGTITMVVGLLDIL